MHCCSLTFGKFFFKSSVTFNYEVYVYFGARKRTVDFMCGGIGVVCKL